MAALPRRRASRCTRRGRRVGLSTAPRGEAAAALESPRACSDAHAGPQQAGRMAPRAIEATVVERGTALLLPPNLSNVKAIPGVIAFDGTRSRCAKQRDDRFPSRASGRRTIAKATKGSPQSEPVQPKPDDRLRPMSEREVRPRIRRRDPPRSRFALRTQPPCVGAALGSESGRPGGVVGASLGGPSRERLPVGVEPRGGQGHLAPVCVEHRSRGAGG